MKRLQHLQSAVGKKQTWCWSERFTAHFHNAGCFETFNVQSLSQLRERLEGQTGVGPTSLVWFNHLRDYLHHSSLQPKLIVIIYLRVFLEKKSTLCFVLG